MNSLEMSTWRICRFRHAPIGSSSLTGGRLSSDSIAEMSFRTAWCAAKILASCFSNEVLHMLRPRYREFLRAALSSSKPRANVAMGSTIGTPSTNGKAGLICAVIANSRSTTSWLYRARSAVIFEMISRAAVSLASSRFSRRRDANSALVSRSAQIAATAIAIFAAEPIQSAALLASTGGVIEFPLVINGRHHGRFRVRAAGFYPANGRPSIRRVLCLEKWDQPCEVCLEWQ
jgi:hypothetical protein